MPVRGVGIVPFLATGSADGGPLAGAGEACSLRRTRREQLPHRDDGITLIQALSRRYLVVAMSIDGSSRAPALQAGAADFLEKNGNPDDILEALHRPLPPA